jgi:hypothetical protein
MWDDQNRRRLARPPARPRRQTMPTDQTTNIWPYGTIFHVARPDILWRPHPDSVAGCRASSASGCRRRRTIRTASLEIRALSHCSAGFRKLILSFGTSNQNAWPVGLLPLPRTRRLGVRVCDFRQGLWATVRTGPRLRSGQRRAGRRGGGTAPGSRARTAGAGRERGLAEVAAQATAHPDCGLGCCGRRRTPGLSPAFDPAEPSRMTAAT